ncbi:MAG: class I SAM-dependent methyltransferase [Bacteroidetes bacterium]|nr:class I SAM-dependent methyltransferase [Bacteroidota bacterium]MBU1371964.1 class I SAM-dependent methyltransferase [Bacteroidota bacterium]MBU1483566.1 class I SAM-dependent methyltransferase [Bacteroidota bacterium]MBU1759297.1 class I SAM-dependent methyltransferase [Bacteroidota bacterium]MBU2045316.1 class I SAM-dependent methyltransferase [Bacteroidota bacterium]
MTKEFWNQRYAAVGFAYGEEANEFLKETLVDIPKGKILFPADGEGRNGVYAATLGWQVSSFDLSEEGKKKALKLASQKNIIQLDYQVGDLKDLSYPEQSFDAIALIFAHFSGDIKSDYHHLLQKYLKKGGYVIFEAFSKNHLAYNSVNPKVGGPKDLVTLTSLEEVKDDFKDFEIIRLEEMEVELNEGNYHLGKGAVVRFIGLKK